MHAIAHFLSQAAHITPSPDNTQPWQLLWENDMLSVKFDAQRVANLTFPADSHATLLTMGALSENIFQAATAVDAQLDWLLPAKLDVHDPVYFQTSINKMGATQIPALETIPLFLRHTNRHPYQRRDLPPECIFQLKKLSQDSARILVFEDKAAIHNIAKLVQKAADIRFQTQEVHAWLAKSLRFNTLSTDQYGEGLDVTTLDLPPGGQLFLRLISDWRRMNWLNKLGTYKAMAMIDSQPVGKAPLVIAVVGPSGFKETMSAGRLMNRAWIGLNQQGIAAHPYYVITDQLQRRQTHSVPLHLNKLADTVFEQTQQLFQLNDDENLHMLFRAGYPVKTAVKSKRLPLETVCLEH